MRNWREQIRTVIFGLDIKQKQNNDHKTTEKFPNLQNIIYVLSEMLLWTKHVAPTTTTARNDDNV